MDNIISRTLDSIIEPVTNFIASILTTVISIKWLSILIWIIIINLVGFILMKRDKQYAKEEKRRVRESTLLATAAVGGSIGIYAGMYRFNHKTLHQKFTIFVPMIMLFQVAFIVYMIFS